MEKKRIRIAFRQHGTQILFCCVAASLVTWQASGQDSTLQRCADLFAKLGKLQEQKENPAKMGPPLTFPADLTKLDAASLEKVKEQISRATGSELLIADPKTLTRPEVQALLAESPARLVIKTDKFDKESIDKILGFKAKTISIYSAIPSSKSEVDSVFGKMPSFSTYWTAQRLGKVAKNIKELKSVSSPRPVNIHAANTKAGLLGTIQNANADDFLLFIGHNEDGVLKLPTGDSVPLSELNAALDARGAKGVVLTCESIRFVRDKAGTEVLTNRKLRFDEIACALSSVVKAASEDVSCRAADNVLRELSRALSECFDKNNARFKIAVGVIGATVLTATIVELVEIDSGDSILDATNSPSSNPPSSKE